MFLEIAAGIVSLTAAVEGDLQVVDTQVVQFVRLVAGKEVAVCDHGGLIVFAHVLEAPVHAEDTVEGQQGLAAVPGDVQFIRAEFSDEAHHLVLRLLRHDVADVAALIAVAAVEIAGHGQGEGEHQAPVAVEEGESAHLVDVVKLVVLPVLHQKAHRAKLHVELYGTGIIVALRVCHDTPDGVKLLGLYDHERARNRVEQQPAVSLRFKESAVP